MDRNGGRVPDSDDRRVLGAIAIAVGVLSALIVLPYLSYVLAAVVLAYVLAPLQRRLRPAIGRTAGALSLLALAFVAILAPLALLVSIGVQQGLDLAGEIADGDIDVNDVDVTDVEEALAGYGIEVDVEAVIASLRNPVVTALQGLATDAIEIVGGVPDFLIGTTVLAFVLFSLLRDGDRFVRWSRGVIPLRAELQDELLGRLDRLMYASIVANAVVAAIQAGLVVIGLAAIDFPGLAFFGILTFLFALLPLIGAFAVWAPIAGYLLLLDRPLAAGFLIAYGSLVSLSDNYVRPIAVGRGANMSAATVIVGIFGGVAVAGLVGLFFGPVVLGAFKTTLDLYARERELRAGERDSGDEPDDESTRPDEPTPPAEPVAEPNGADGETGPARRTGRSSTPERGGDPRDDVPADSEAPTESSDPVEDESADRPESEPSDRTESDPSDRAGNDD